MIVHVGKCKKRTNIPQKKCQEVISYVNNTDIHKVMRIAKLYADKNKWHEKFFCMKSYKYFTKALRDIVEIFLWLGMK